MTTDWFENPEEFVNNLFNDQIKSGIETTLSPLNDEMKKENVTIDFIKNENGVYTNIKISGNASEELKEKINDIIKSIVWKYK